jgi:hypothetical protein
MIQEIIIVRKERYLIVIEHILLYFESALDSDKRKHAQLQWRKDDTIL